VLIRPVRQSNNLKQLGTLGTGNHFIEVCLDETDRVWLMLHSGSRGVGNKIGTYFIELAKQDMRHLIANLPDKDLAYFSEGTEHFGDYVDAVEWAQDFAMTNRRLMMDAVVRAVRSVPGIPPFEAGLVAVNCHHKYVARERHYGQDVLVTRKGAVRARAGDLGIIPGSMGVRSYIVRGRGNPEAFDSCSHGAGRAMSRAEAKRRFRWPTTWRPPPASSAARTGRRRRFPRRRLATSLSTSASHRELVRSTACRVARGAISAGSSASAGIRAPSTRTGMT
jgi:tRNA-splicing ligase RtcB